MKDLPKTLDETYSRILFAIDNDGTSEEAHKILRWIACAERPLAILEVLEVPGIFLDSEPRFDNEYKLRDPSDILRICSSLVSIFTTNKDGSEKDGGLTHALDFDKEGYDPARTFVRLAHFSVKEYLVSTRPVPARYCLLQEESHDMLASSCIVYLLRFENQEWLHDECESNFPLARYAAKFWTRHARVLQERSQHLESLSMKILTQNPMAFEAWLRFYDILKPWDEECDISRAMDEPPSPLYAASRTGLAHAILPLLMNHSLGIDTQWGEQGSALYAASLEGHDEIVKILLAKGADLNAQGGRLGNALQAAINEGHETIIELFLAKGANVNVQGGIFGNALQAASFRGYEGIIKMLLTKGAEINAQGGDDGSALQAAAVGGHEQIVEMLLTKGANVNAQGGRHGSALQGASYGGFENIAEMLLATGADVNAQGGLFGSALQAASLRGCERIVEMLLAKGANVNAQGGQFGSALQAASAQGFQKIVHILLGWGADRNVESLNEVL